MKMEWFLDIVLPMNAEQSHPWQLPAIIYHTQRLIKSFQQWTGHSLIQKSNSPEETAQSLFEAPFVVVSHGTEADPIFNYANQLALDLWELDWQQFIRTPSRATAESVEWVDREQLLAAAKQHGYIDNYQGVRISSTGKRFRIKNVILWEVLDEKGDRCGQAATFDQWEML